MRKTERGERSLKFDSAVLIEKFVSAFAKFRHKFRVIVHGVFEIYAAAFVANAVKIAARRGKKRVCFYEIHGKIVVIRRRRVAVPGFRTFEVCGILHVNSRTEGVRL